MTPRPFLLALLLAVPLAGAAAPRALAEDPAVPPAAGGAPDAAGPARAGADASAVARLTAEELAILRRRMPDFDRRDDAMREKIARNVLRLRTLSASERDRLLSRLRRVEGEGGPGVAETDERVRRFQELGKKHVLEGARHVRAAALVVVGALPEPARAFVTPGAGERSLAPTERLRLDVCLAMAWKRRVLEGLVARPPLDAEPTAGAASAPAFVAARERVRASGGATAPEGERRRFALALVEDRFGAAQRAFQAATPAVVTPPTTPPKPDTPPAPDPVRVEAFARVLRESFPGAAEAVAADLARAIDGGREGVARFCAESGAERATPRDRTLVELVFGLERARAVLGGDLLAKANELQLAALRELKVAEADLVELQSATDEKARLLVLAPLKRRLAGFERGPHGEALFPRMDRWMGGGRRGGMGDGKPDDGK